MSGALSSLAGPTTSPATGSPYQAPIGPVGGNALIDWLGAGNLPSIPNPASFGNFFFGGGGRPQVAGGGGGNLQGDFPWLTQQQQPRQSEQNDPGAWWKSMAAKPPQSAPTLPNPDIGTFGTGGNAPQRPQFGPGPTGAFGPHNDPRWAGMMHGMHMPMSAGPGSK